MMFDIRNKSSKLEGNGRKEYPAQRMDLCEEAAWVLRDVEHKFLGDARFLDFELYDEMEEDGGHGSRKSEAVPSCSP